MWLKVVDLCCTEEEKLSSPRRALDLSAFSCGWRSFFICTTTRRLGSVDRFKSVRQGGWQSWRACLVCLCLSCKIQLNEAVEALFAHKPGERMSLGKETEKKGHPALQARPAQVTDC